MKVTKRKEGRGGEEGEKDILICPSPVPKIRRHGMHLEPLKEELDHFPIFSTSLHIVFIASSLGLTFNVYECDERKGLETCLHLCNHSHTCRLSVAGLFSTVKHLI